MSDLHNEILEELMTIDDAGNGQDEAIETIINIVREYDYENHEVLQVWKKDIRADERARIYDLVIKTVPGNVVRLFLSELMKSIRKEE